MGLAYLALFVFIFSKQSTCNTDVPSVFEKINRNLVQYNVIAADIAWKSTVDPGNAELPDRAAKYERSRLDWQHRTCELLKTIENGHLLNRTQRRQMYLLCRGPTYLPSEARHISTIYDVLQDIYSGSKICVPTNHSAPIDAEAAILNFVTSVKSQKERTGDAGKLAVDNFENGMCFEGEADFEILMRSRNEEVLKWSWLAWREAVGPSMRKPYSTLVQVENVAARRNGYKDIGHAWREELETPNLRVYARALYREVRPLYVALHGIVRFFLRQHYDDLVPESGLIPAHLLGDLWSQNWGNIVDLILPEASQYDLDNSIKDTNWTILDMVRKAQDFYMSMSLPPMTDAFWRNSVFERERGARAGDVRCHGTAANMYRGDDYRMLYCAEVTMQDFYVIHHEMGHIQYYMSYQDQPGIFQEGTNSAFHEMIGDAIMYGVMTPQHLHRLGLINDTLLYNNDNEQNDRKSDLNSKESVEIFLKFVKAKERDDGTKTGKYNEGNLVETKIKTDNEFIFNSKELKYKAGFNNIPIESEEINTSTVNNKKVIDATFDEIHLLKQALVKIPQIPFSLLIDEYRWALDEEDFDERSYNEEFWKLVVELQGVAPPEGKRGEEYFDAGAKYHVPDNTPYIRYFLSSFLQTQVFRSLCRAAVLGVANTASELPPHLPLHRCDIYGSKQPGRLLKRMMSQGASVHWREALNMLTNEEDISSEALLQYYLPLYPILTKLIQYYDIPLGW